MKSLNLGHLAESTLTTELQEARQKAGLEITFLLTLLGNGLNKNLMCGIKQYRNNSFKIMLKNLLRPSLALLKKEKDLVVQQL